MLKLKIQLQGLDSTFLFQARLDQLPQDSIRVEAGLVCSSLTVFLHVFRSNCFGNILGESTPVMRPTLTRQLQQIRNGYTFRTKIRQLFSLRP